MEPEFMSNPKHDPEVANEKAPVQAPRLLDRLEQISRISVPIMIPVVIALIGYFGNDLLNARQNVIEQKKIDLEYVKIAKDIVSNVKAETDTRIVNWAYQTLFQLSPVKVSQEDVDDLSKRRVPLPSSTTPTVLGGASSSGRIGPGWFRSTKKVGSFAMGLLLPPKWFYRLLIVLFADNRATLKWQQGWQISQDRKADSGHENRCASGVLKRQL